MLEVLRKDKKYQKQINQIFELSKEENNKKKGK